MKIENITGVSGHTEQYPLLSDEELQALADDIAENGLFDPITVTSDGLLLDGRNRLRACEIAGVEPRIDIYDGDEDQIGAFVRSKNRRRHQPTGSRAMSEALSMQLDGKRNGGRWDQKSFSSTDLSNSLVARIRQCGIILDHRPDLAAEVVNGDKALDAAYQDAIEERDRERNRLAEQERLKAEESDAEAFVKENAPDLAARVDGEDLHSYVEARDIWSRRNREEAAELRRKQEQERKQEREERDNAIQRIQSVQSAHYSLNKLTVEEHRAFIVRDLHRFPDQRAKLHNEIFTPNHIRSTADALNSLASDMEANHG